MVIINGTTGIDTIQDGVVTNTEVAGTNNTQLATTSFVHSAITNDLHVTGSAPMYACRSWVNFDGTNTVTIRASGNVSSITDNGVGDYTLNFATAFSDINYSAVLGMRGQSTSGRIGMEQHDAPLRTTTQLRIYVLNPSNQAPADPTVASVSIFI